MNHQRFPLPFPLARLRFGLALLVMLDCATSGFAAAAATDEKESEEFRPLFNGRDLEGWVVVNTAPSTWRFDADGMLICSGKPIGEIRTERMFQNFVLELEWRHLVPKGNAGIFVWADDITARGQPFHRGIEVQVLENAYGNTEGHTTHGDIFPIHGATMDPLTGHRRGKRAFPTEHRSLPSPQWNHYRIEAIDGKISLAVNGKVVTRGENCSPRKGYLCIESEGGIVHYRKVRIVELPDSPIDAADVAIENRGYRSLYTGVDLSGWQETGAPGWKSRDWVLGFDGETSQETGRLVSDEIFGDIGFLFDVAPAKQSSGAPRVLLRGSEAAAIAIDPGDDAMAPHLEKPGNWNRFEGTIRGDQLTLSLNGNTILEDQRLEGVPASGPIVLESSGPVKWANIFVRPLSFPGK